MLFIASAVSEMGTNTMSTAIFIWHSLTLRTFRIGLEPTKECAAISGYHRNEICNDEQRSNSRSVVNNIQYTLIIKLGCGKFPNEMNIGTSRVTANNRWTSNYHRAIFRNCFFVTGLSD